MPNAPRLLEQLHLYSQLKHEYGAAGIAPILAHVEEMLTQALASIQALPESVQVAMQEPNELPTIQQCRPAGMRRLWTTFDEPAYRRRLEGALVGRFAGCTLGAPVEFWPVARMESWAREIGDAFPPVDYWSSIPEPQNLRYGVSRCDAYTRGKMHGVPVDDDITYTVLGLLIAEDYGLNFTVREVGEAWVKYLPYACTAEDIALKNLQKGIPAEQAGVMDNPFCEWIGADIRADAWGLLAPGLPQKAAEMAYQDAYISHRRNGIYGEMYFAAAIATAFTVDHPVDALRLALAEIPAECAMANAVRWALDVAPSITDYREARAAIEEHFEGMHRVHTINNACLTIWGLTIGGTDMTRVIGETVAMGMDNDCTAATAGCICGAVIGQPNIPAHWSAHFENTVHTYINGHPHESLSDLVSRFSTLAERAVCSEQ